MALHNVVIKTRVAAMNIDSYNRTAVCTSDIDNGSVFKLVKKSTTVGEKDVWVAEQAAATDKGLWIATSPEVVITKVGDLEMKNIVVDPRYFVNNAGRMIDATFLNVGDEIEIYSESIENISTKDYLVPAADKFALKAADAAGTGLSLHKIGTDNLHIGQTSIAKTPLPTYRYVVEIN